MVTMMPKMPEQLTSDVIALQKSIESLEITSKRGLDAAEAALNAAQTALNAAGAKPGWGGFIGTAVGGALAAGGLVIAANLVSINFAQSWVEQKFNNAALETQKTIDDQTHQLSGQIADLGSKVDNNGATLTTIRSDIRSLGQQQDGTSGALGKLGQDVASIVGSLQFQSQVLAAVGRQGLSAQVVAADKFFVSDESIIVSAWSQEFAGDAENGVAPQFKSSEWKSNTAGYIEEATKKLSDALEGTAFVVRTTSDNAPNVWGSDVPPNGVLIFR